MARPRYEAGPEHSGYYGSELRRRAAAAGLTGSDIGRRLGITNLQIVQRWMRGLGRPPTENERQAIDHALTAAGEVSTARLEVPSEPDVHGLIAAFRRDLAARLRVPVGAIEIRVSY